MDQRDEIAKKMFGVKTYAELDKGRKRDVRNILFSMNYARPSGFAIIADDLGPDPEMTSERKKLLREWYERWPALKELTAPSRGDGRR